MRVVQFASLFRGGDEWDETEEEYVGPYDDERCTHTFGGDPSSVAKGEADTNETVETDDENAETTPVVGE